jgi:hypothetical protein
VNGYFLSGAQTQRAIEKAIDLALDDHRAGRKPKNLDPAMIK